VRHFGRIETDPITGMSGREQILQRMRTVDVLLLLHGVEPICAEYIPSKMYEYLWMQRPILALVYRNPQMSKILQVMGHRVIETDIDLQSAKAKTEQVAEQLAMAALVARWQNVGLADIDATNCYTTLAAVSHLLDLVGLRGRESACL
jgi:hypothetical protein